jgi:hypothetical protein
MVPQTRALYSVLAVIAIYNAVVAAEECRSTDGCPICKADENAQLCSHALG